MLKDLYNQIYTIIQIKVNEGYQVNLPYKKHNPSKEDVLDLFQFYIEMDKNPRYIIWNTVMTSLIKDELYEKAKYLLVMTSCARDDIHYFNEFFGG